MKPRLDDAVDTDECFVVEHRVEQAAEHPDGEGEAGEPEREAEPRVRSRIEPRGDEVANAPERTAYGSVPDHASAHCPSPAGTTETFSRALSSRVGCACEYCTIFHPLKVPIAAPSTTSDAQCLL